MRARNAKTCRFQVELLEGRIPLSTVGPPLTGAAQVAPKGDREVPYKESVTLVSTSGMPGTPGFVSIYSGNATHMGHITITTKITAIDSEGNITQSFTRTAANGDTMYGTTFFTTAGTLTITVENGTGRFAGVTGTQMGTATVSNGVTTVEAKGTLTFPAK
jgi:hypothetical protein